MIELVSVTWSKRFVEDRSKRGNISKERTRRDHFMCVKARLNKQNNLDGKEWCLIEVKGVNSNSSLASKCLMMRRGEENCEAYEVLAPYERRWT